MPPGIAARGEEGIEYLVPIGPGDRVAVIAHRHVDRCSVSDGFEPDVPGVVTDGVVVLALAFGLLIVFLVVGGSVWIMSHLNQNMMPMDQIMQIQR